MNGTTVWGRHVVLATGSRPRVPDCRASRRPASSRTRASSTSRRSRSALVVMGGGPIGVELGQAFRRLGSEGHDRVLHVRTVCPKEDADVAAVLAASLRAEGVDDPERWRVGGARRSRRADGANVVTVKPRAARRSRSRRTRSSSRRGAARTSKAWASRTPASRSRRRASRRTRSAGRTCRPSGRSATSRGPTSSRTGRATRPASSSGTRSPPSRSRPATLRTRRGSRTRSPRSRASGSSEEGAKAKGVPHRVFRAAFRHNDRAICDGTPASNFAKVLVDPKGQHPRRRDRPPARRRPPRRDRPREEERAAALGARLGHPRVPVALGDPRRRGPRGAEDGAHARPQGDAHEARRVPQEVDVQELLRSFQGWVVSLGPAGWVLYALVYAVCCVLFVPASILTLGAGAIYGLGTGTSSSSSPARRSGRRSRSCSRNRSCERGSSG